MSMSHPDLSKLGNSRYAYSVGALYTLAKNVKLHTENLELIKDNIRNLEIQDLVDPEDVLLNQTGDMIDWIELLEDAVERLDDFAMIAIGEKDQVPIGNGRVA